MKKPDARSLVPAAQEVIRRKAVVAVRQGQKQIIVAKIFGVTPRIVNKWVKQYRVGGMKSLCGKPQGRPRGGKLKGWQAARIAQIVIDRHPEQLKLPFYLWTREAVAQLIERKYGIHLSVWTVGRYLARWGFTPQKPMRQAFERNNPAVNRWLQKEYPAIRQRAKREKAEIYWRDEMGMRSDHAVGRTYSLCGQTPSFRERVNALAVT